MTRKNALTALLVVLILFPAPALAGDRFSSRIERFLEILESNPSYHVSHDYDLYGEGEMTIDHYLCGEDLELTPHERTLCVEIAAKRKDDSKSVPSLLLLWLRTKLPTNPTITLLKINPMPRYARHNVTAKLDETTVVFIFYNEGPSYQPMDVHSINGVNIFDLLKQDIKNGLSLSTLLQTDD